MKFKELLKEKFERKSVGWLIDNDFDRPHIPLTTKMIRRLTGKKFKRRKVWHMTDIEHIYDLFKLQGKKKQISSFTNVFGPQALMTKDLLTDSDLLVDIDADVILDAPEDIFTMMDKQGRRWVPISDLERSLREIPNTEEARKDIHNLEKDLRDLLKKVKIKYKITSMDRTWHSDGSRYKDVKNKVIKEYIDGVEKLLDKPDVNFFIFKVLQKIKRAGPTREGWDELVVNNIKINRIIVLKDKWDAPNAEQEVYNELGSMIAKKIDILSATTSEMYKEIKKRYNRRRFQF